MRFKVELRYGYVSFDERDEARARALFADEGIRLWKGPRLGEESEFVAGVQPGTKAVAA